MTRSSGGKYSCSALNSEGETVSNDFLLKVKFVPQCATDKMMVVGATKGEDIQLTCEIKSYPLPKRFYWKFENSEESVEIDQRKFSNNGTKSVLSFSTATDHVTLTLLIESLEWLDNISKSILLASQDYGSLSCWAKNEIGIQSQPCVFQLILAASPAPVTNCSWSNESETTLVVNCSPNYDGGLPQTFVLEILSVKHKVQLYGS